MKISYIILASTALLASAYGSGRGSLLKDVSKDNVDDRFNVAVSDGKEGNFVRALLAGENYESVEVLGDKAYEHINVSQNNVASLLRSGRHRLIEGFFKFYSDDREAVVTHLMALRAYDTLEALGSEAYKHIPVSKTYIGPLVRDNKLTLFKGFFVAHPDDHKDIVEIIVALKAFTFLKATENEDVYKHIPVEKTSVITSIETREGHPDLFKKFFESHSTDDHEEIVELMPPSAYYMLKDIESDDVYKYIPVSKISMGALLNARNDHPDLFEKFFEYHPDSHEEIVNYLMSRNAYDVLNAIGDAAYKCIEVNDRSTRQLSDTNDPKLFTGFFVTHPDDRGKIVERLITLRHYTTLKGIVEDALSHFPKNKKSVQTLVAMEDWESLRTFYKSLEEDPIEPDCISKKQCEVELKRLNAFKQLQKA